MRAALRERVTQSPRAQTEKLHRSRSSPQQAPVLAKEAPLGDAGVGFVLCLGSLAARHMQPREIPTQKGPKRGDSKERGSRPTAPSNCLEARAHGNKAAPPEMCKPPRTNSVTEFDSFCTFSGFFVLFLQSFSFLPYFRPLPASTSCASPSL